jgi:hypothetical protein
MVVIKFLLQITLASCCGCCTTFQQQQIAKIKVECAKKLKRQVLWISCWLKKHRIMHAFERKKHKKEHYYFLRGTIQKLMHTGYNT